MYLPNVQQCAGGFVAFSEPAEGLRLNESRIKAITGRSRMAARFLFHDEFEFEAETLKLPVFQLVPTAPLSREFELVDETLELSAVQAEKNTSMEHVLLIAAVPTRALPTIPLSRVERK